MDILGVKFNNEEISEYDKEGSRGGKIEIGAYIPYSLNKNDNPYVTFEMTMIYKYELNGEVEIPFENGENNLFKFSITSNKFSYNNMKGEISRNNKIKNIGNNLIISGEEKQDEIQLYFSLKLN